MANNIIYRGSLETPNYSFEAYSLTEDGARRALKRAWNNWRRVCMKSPHPPASMWTWSELWEGGDAYVMAYQLDTPYMDREVFK